MPAAFELRPGEDYLSVNWLEYWRARDFETAIEHVRDVFRTQGFGLRANGRFAVLNVGAVRTAVSENVNGVGNVRRVPLADDDSHSGVFGYATDDFAVAVAIRALVTRDSVHPAIADTSA